jgi:DNA-directed RNA polymerase specialized sigma54-like protein
MDMELQLSPAQKMRQEMQLSQRQLQSLKYLQAQIGDLREMVRDELMRNPVLEEADGGDPVALRKDDGDDDGYEEGKSAGELDYTGEKAAAREEGEGHDWLMANQAAPLSLEDYLRRNVCAGLPEEEARAADAVLERLDPQGLFTGDEEEIAAEAGVPVETVRSVLALLKECAPPPELRVGEDPTIYRWPVATIRRDDEGRLVVEMQEDGLPRLRVQERYRKMMDDPHVRGADREYVKKRIEEGEFLIGALEMRQETLRGIVQAVADTQADFFERGRTGLHPLSQADVAKRLKRDASTVSRAIQDKWVDTPQGTFELKHFFAHGGTEDVSAEAAKAALERLIDREPPGKPLSDQALADALAAQGIPLARRTVAKYREAMGVPPAHLRK